MEGIKSITVGPEISPAELAEVWEEAMREVAGKPGRTVSILFAPGVYPLPNHGAYAYKEKPTAMRVSSPGMEIQFTWENGRIKMITKNTHSLRGRT